MEKDRRTHQRFQQGKGIHITNILCLAHYTVNNENILTTDASTKDWAQHCGDLKPVGNASRFLSDTERKYAINELELLAFMWELKLFRLHIYGRPIELLTHRQALEQLIKRNRSNKTYSATLTRRLDRLAHFYIKITHNAGKHQGLTDFLSRNPVSKPEPTENYDKESVINCIIPLFELINNHGSINESKIKKRTDHSKKCELKTNQSQNSYQNKPKSSDGKTNERSPLLSTQQKVSTLTLSNKTKRKWITKRSNFSKKKTQQQKHLPYQIDGKNWSNRTIIK